MSTVRYRMVTMGTETIATIDPIVTTSEIIMPTESTTTTTQINGVLLLTRSGKPKSRYSDDERLQILGATREDLKATVELFCPRQPFYAMTRLRTTDPRDWTTPRGRISDREILRHLQGDQIPEQLPRWVAPRSWETTQWVGIDVDYRGDKDDFDARCKKVYKALNELGVTKRRRLVSETPSGGIHVRFFLTRVIRVSQIPDVLGKVGLHESCGQVELFPRTTKGMRLPFGHIPGKKDNPQDWLSFIRAYQEGKYPLVDWLKCMKRAERFAENRLVKEFRSENSTVGFAREPQPEQTVNQKKYCCGNLGIPKRNRLQLGEKSGVSRKRYMELLSQPCSSPEMAEEIWEFGIQAAGTRITATKVLAWHFLRVRNFSVSKVTSILTKWVHKTGEKTSNDVQRDLQFGTNKVEVGTESIINWTASCKRVDAGFSKTKIGFSKEEVDEVIKQVSSIPSTELSTLIIFALRFLGFAKLNGEETENGWNTQIAVRGVIRKWPGCSGMKYKPRMDFLAQIGLIKLTREKLQSPNRTGRPRTYEFVISPNLNTGAKMTIEEAICYATESLMSEKPDRIEATSSNIPVDTYKRFKPPIPLKKTRKEREEATQGKTRFKKTAQATRQTSGRVKPLVCSSANLSVGFRPDENIGSQIAHNRPMLMGIVSQTHSAHEQSDCPRLRPPILPCKKHRLGKRFRTVNSGLTKFSEAERERFRKHQKVPADILEPSSIGIRQSAITSHYPAAPEEPMEHNLHPESEDDGVDESVKERRYLSKELTCRSRTHYGGKD